MSTSRTSLRTSDDLLICGACGTQYKVTEADGKNECRICEDPRQFVPPSGQSFTTLSRMRRDGYRNVVERSDVDRDGVWEVWTEPKFGIGQRACLIKTPHGNVLWDLISFLDEKTVEEIQQLGGISMIVISHPHFYTTWADWSRTFNCPVYMTRVDSDAWANRTHSPSLPDGASLKLLEENYTEILPGITAAICGGHFPGSMVLHDAHHQSLFVADTIFAVASAFNPDPTKPGIVTYSFLWSIPNMIPLSPDAILQIWKVIKGLDRFGAWTKTYGVMAKVRNVEEKPGLRLSLKGRLLQSAKVTVKLLMDGKEEHEIFSETE